MGRPLDLSIGKWLAIGFGAAGSLLVIFVVLSFLALGRIGDLLEHQSAVIGPRSDIADRLKIDILNKAIAARSYALTRGAEHRRAYEGYSRRVEQDVAKLAALPMGLDGEAVFRPIPGLIDDLTQASDELMTRAVSVPELSQLRSLEAEVVELREKALAAVREFNELQHEKEAAAQAAIDQTRRGLAQMLFASSLLLIAVLGVTAVLTARRVRGPALALVDAARKLAEGDYGPAVGMAGACEQKPLLRNELSHLARSFGCMALDLREREQRLAARARLAKVLARDLDIDRLCEGALREIVAFTQVELGAIYVIESEPESSDGSSLRRAAGFAVGPEGKTFALGEGLPGQAACGRETIVVRDIPVDLPFTVHFGVERLPPRALAAVPLCLGEQLLGVLLAGSVRDLPREALSFFEDSAKQLAVSLQNARAHARIHELVRALQVRNEELQAQQEELQAQQEELQAQNEELQGQSEELQAQREELQSQSEKLQDADRRKNGFLAVLSHELRNPLAPIRNSLFVLDRVPPEGEQARRARAVIDRQVEHLTRLIDDLLDVTRITHGKIPLRRERVDLTKLLRQAADDNAAHFERNQLHFELRLPETPLWVEADPDRLAQVTSNLLQNAAKFTPSQGSVSLVCGASGDGGRSVEVRVVDTGMGIEPEVLRGLFQPFMQADGSLARTTGGLGLGLALVKGLIELHGGKVAASSPGPGKGAEFSFVLPLVSAAEHHAEPPADRSLRSAGASRQAGEPRPDGRPLALELQPEPTRPAKHDGLGRPSALAEAAAAAVPGAERVAAQRRVLVVEDNIDAAESLKEALELGGHEVEVAYDGARGLHLAREQKPEVVLCDLGLPEMSGYDVARACRADREMDDVLLVALTGYALPEDQRRASAAGFDRHIAKPPSLKQLEELLATVPLRQPEPAGAPSRSSAFSRVGRPAG